jgi:HEAT repeat protein
MDIMPNPLPLNRTHTQMNKFAGPDDGDYKVVVGEIVRILRQIRGSRIPEKADAHIKNHHYTDETLKIERISNERLRMESCYVNLAIIQDSAKEENRSGREDISQFSPFSLDHRLNIQTPSDDKKVEIEHLFDARETGKDSPKPPRKILIRGQAGIGKSTLCKKFVHNFKSHGMWNELFDRILWVPLRNLKTLAEKDCNIAGMFRQEYFSQRSDGEDLSKQFWNYLQAKGYEKTLFILDGLDEVYKESKNGSILKRLLDTLLGMPALIVTSRPQGLVTGQNFDLELETIGFYPKQIDLYIKAVFPENSEKAKDLRSILQQHQILRGLVRIPIQLDALCYILDAEENNLLTKSQMQNMTGIYQAIAASLWTKDILALGKKNNTGVPLEKDELQNLSLKEIESFVPDEVYFLEGLAFTGMASDTIKINFTKSDYRELRKLLPSKDLPFLPEKLLSCTSFLRTSNPSSNNPDYHFLHLTFQEYFAARHFARRWRAEKTLPSEDDDNSKSMENFLKHHKYDANYDIFWRFVAGLLSIDNQKLTLGFFQAISREPLDLLGPVHQRLLMHCLSEVPRETGAFGERKALEDKLVDWHTFEHKFAGLPRLIREIEFPEAPLRRVLQSTSMDDRNGFVVSLMCRPIIPIDVISTVCSWRDEDYGTRVNSSLKIHILEMLGHQQGTLPENAINFIIEGINDGEWSVRSKAFDTLEQFPALEARMLDALTAQVKSTKNNERFRRRAIEVLESQSCVDRELITFLEEELRGENAGMRTICVNALAHHLSDEILRSITMLLKDTDSNVSSTALRVLRSQQKRSDDMFQTLTALLQGEEDVTWREEGIEFLEDWPQCEDMIYDLVKVLLSSEKDKVRADCLRALARWSDLSDKILGIVANQLEHEENLVRYIALRIFGARPQLSNNVLNAIKIRPKSETSYVLGAAIKVLITHSPNDNDTRDIVRTRLRDDQDASNRVAVLNALRYWRQPDDEVIGLVVEQLNAHCSKNEIEVEEHCSESEIELKEDALQTLGKWPLLSETVLETIASQLGNTNWGVQAAAAEALRNRPPQPTSAAMEAIARNLMILKKDFQELPSSLGLDSDGLRSRSLPYPDEVPTLLKALTDWPQLDDSVLVAFAGLLQHDKEVAFEEGLIIDYFCSRPQPSNKVINEFTARPGGARSIGPAALRALGNWTQLDTDTLSTIADVLESSYIWDHEAAFRVLVNQKPPPFEVLEKHMKSLYKMSLRRGFREHVYWLIENGKPCIVVGSRRIDWNNKDERNGSSPTPGSSLGVQLREEAPKWLASLGFCELES